MNKFSSSEALLCAVLFPTPAANAQTNYQDGLRDGTISPGARFGINLLREFVFPK